MLAFTSKGINGPFFVSLSYTISVKKYKLNVLHIFGRVCVKNRVLSTKMYHCNGGLPISQVAPLDQLLPLSLDSSG